MRVRMRVRIREREREREISREGKRLSEINYCMVSLML